VRLPADFSFDPDKHRFSCGGTYVPSVTQILGDLGFFKNSNFYTEEGRIRGQHIHTAISLLEKGILDMGSVGEDLKGYVEAYLDWRERYKSKPLYLDEIVFNRDYWYAGIVDLRARGGMIVDFKTGSFEDWHLLQIAAYGLCYPKGMSNLMDVYLKPNGKWTIKQAKWEDCADWSKVVHTYRRKHR
jgi:hypothetical protein